MPALSYDYNYAKTNKRKQDLARQARSSSASQKMNASQKVAKKNRNQVDVPIVVKKKVELQKPEEMKLKKPKAKNESKQKVETAKKSILTTVVAFCVVFVICVRYAQINELTHKLKSLEKNLVAVESLNEQLSTEVESKTDLSYIEKYAKYQLGMQKPEERQIVRIAYDKQDKISTPVLIEEEKEPNFFEKMWKDLLNLVD